MKHLRSPVQVYAEAFVFSLTPASIARTCSRAHDEARAFCAAHPWTEFVEDRIGGAS